MSSSTISQFSQENPSNSSPRNDVPVVHQEHAAELSGRPVLTQPRTADVPRADSAECLPTSNFQTGGQNDTIWGARSAASATIAPSQGQQIRGHLHHSSRRHRSGAIGGDICDAELIERSTTPSGLPLQKNSSECEGSFDSTASTPRSGSSASLGSFVARRRFVEIRRLAHVVSTANASEQGNVEDAPQDYGYESSSVDSDPVMQYVAQTSGHRAFLRRTRGAQGNAKDFAEFKRLCRGVQRSAGVDALASDSSTSEFDKGHLLPRKARRAALVWEPAERRWVRGKANASVQKPASARRFVRFFYPQHVPCCRSAQHIFVTAFVITLMSFLVVPILTMSMMYQHVVSAQDTLFATCIVQPTVSAIHVGNLNSLLFLVSLFSVHGGSNISITVPLTSDASGDSPASFVSSARFLSAHVVNNAFIGGADHLWELTGSRSRAGSLPTELHLALSGSERALHDLISSFLANPVVGSSDRLRTETVLFSWARYLLSPKKMVDDSGSWLVFQNVSSSLSARHRSVATLLKKALGGAPLRGKREWERVVSFVFGKRGSRVTQSSISQKVPAGHAAEQELVRRIEAWVSRQGSSLLSQSSGYLGRHIDKGLRDRGAVDEKITSSRSGELLRRLGNLATSRVLAVQQRQLLFGELLSTPIASSANDVVMSVIQSSSTVVSHTFSNSTSVLQSGISRFPLGSDTSSRASTLEFSLARIYFDIVPVVRLRDGSPTNVSATLYTDDLFTREGDVVARVRLPDLSFFSRAFPVSGRVPTLPSYSSTTNMSLRVVNDVADQLLGEGPLGTASMSILLTFQREVIRGLSSVCQLARLSTLNASSVAVAECSESTLFREISRLSSSVFSNLVLRASLLLSKVSDGTLADHRVLDTRSEDSDLFFRLVRGFCPSEKSRPVPGRSGRSACNPELWRRYGSTFSGNASLYTIKSSLPSRFAHEISLEDQALKRNINRLLKALALLRYDMKVRASAERSSAPMEGMQLEAFLDFNLSHAFTRPADAHSQSHQAFVSAVSYPWLVKAISSTKALGLLHVKMGQYESRVLSALAFGANTRFRNGVAKESLDVGGGGSATEAAIFTDGVIELGTPAPDSSGQAIDTISRGDPSLRKAIDLLFTAFSDSDTDAISSDSFGNEDLGVLTGLLSRNPFYPSSGVTIPLDAGNSVSDSLALLFDQSASDSPWFEERNEDFQGLTALIMLAIGIAEAQFSLQLDVSERVLSASTNIREGGRGTVSWDNFDSIERFAALHPVLSEGRVGADSSQFADGDGIQSIVAWFPSSPKTIVIVCTAVFAGVLPALLLLWGVLGIGVKASQSHLPFRCLFLFYSIVVLVTVCGLGATISYLGIEAIRTQGMASFEDVSWPLRARLEALARPSSLGKPDILGTGLQNGSHITSLSASDVVLNSNVFHYVPSVTSPRVPVSEKLLDFFDGFFIHTLRPVLTTVVAISNETSTAALLMGGVLSQEEVISAIEDRLRGVSQIVPSKTDSLGRMALEAPFVRSRLLRNSLSVSSLASPLPMNITNRSMLTSKQHSKYASLLSNGRRQLIVQQLSPFRALQTVSCACEMEEQSPTGAGRPVPGCDARAQQLLSAVMGVSNVLGAFTGGLSSNGVSVADGAQSALAGQSIAGVTFSAARQKVTAMASDELVAARSDCANLVSDFLSDAACSPGRRLTSCPDSGCGRVLRYTGMPNTFSDAFEEGHASDVLSAHSSNPLLLFKSSFSPANVFPMGIACSPSAQQPVTPESRRAEGRASVHALDVFDLELASKELTETTALIHTLIRERISSVLYDVRVMTSESLRLTTRLVVWISIGGCVLIQLAVLLVYRFALFDYPNPSHLL